MIGDRFVATGFSIGSAVSRAAELAYGIQAEQCEKPIAAKCSGAVQDGRRGPPGTMPPIAEGSGHADVATQSETATESTSSVLRSSVLAMDLAQGQRLFR